MKMTWLMEVKSAAGSTVTVVLLEDFPSDPVAAAV
jgi:hypothetical protein